MEANAQGAGIPVTGKNYFCSQSFSTIQMQLLGANAHINGDIWQAMRSSFSKTELEMLRNDYRKFNHSLDQIFSGVYAEAIRSQKKLWKLHRFSLGLDKAYGRRMLRRWRNRQWKLAYYNYSSEIKF